jgi:hypothetical protein
LDSGAGDKAGTDTDTGYDASCGCPPAAGPAIVGCGNLPGRDLFRWCEVDPRPTEGAPMLLLYDLVGAARRLRGRVHTVGVADPAPKLPGMRQPELAGEVLP